MRNRIALPRLSSLLARVTLGSIALVAAACAGAAPEGGDDATNEEPVGSTQAALTTSGAQHFQTGGLPGNMLGYAMASGRFNNDSYDDLVIGAPYVSEIEIRTGTSSGLLSSPTVLAQGSPGVPGTYEAWDYFGKALATGDFNNDGFSDIAVGVPYQNYSETVGPVTFTYSAAGAVNIIYGPLGNPAVSGQLFQRSDLYIPGGPQDNEQFGHALTTGDFNGDGYDDLAIGCPYRNASLDDSGAVVVVYGTSSGLAPAGSGSIPAAQEWMQGSGGIQGVAEAGDRFGFALAAGDFDGDGADDLAVGVPREDTNLTNVGVVNVIYGASGGLSSSGDVILEGDEDLVAYTPAEHNEFGFSLAAGKFNTDGYDDLVVGVPYASVSGLGQAGGVVAVRGSSSGLSGTSYQFINQGSTNIPDSPEAEDQCGTSVAVGDFNNDGYGDIVLGCPYEDVGSGLNHGAFNLAYGPLFTSSTGEFWTQGSSGVGSSTAGAAFGFSLASGDFDGDGYDDVAAGAPAMGGEATVLYGN